MATSGRSGALDVLLTPHRVNARGTFERIATENASGIAAACCCGGGGALEEVNPFPLRQCWAHADDSFVCAQCEGRAAGLRVRLVPSAVRCVDAIVRRFQMLNFNLTVKLTC